MYKCAILKFAMFGFILSLPTFCAIPSRIQRLGLCLVSQCPAPDNLGITLQIFSKHSRLV